MKEIKKILRPYYIALYKRTRGLRLIANYINDYRLFKRHSVISKKNDIKNKEADIILQYHGLEKGMLFSEMKEGFAKRRIEKLHILLSDPEVIENCHRCQIKVGYQVMSQYYELHLQKGYDIEDIYTKDQYHLYQSVLNTNNDSKFSGYIDWTKEDFFSSNDKDFKQFAHSRKSTREFTGKIFSHGLLDKVIKLANTAPSVCNRQASNVYLLEDKKKIDAVLKIQGGFTGYSDHVNQLLILTNDRKYYYTIGERNQFYIDGGVYLLNLLYALHYYKIGNCPANWGKTYDAENRLSEIISIPESEKIICMIPIGKLSEKFRTTLSQRRDITENFIKL